MKGYKNNWIIIFIAIIILLGIIYYVYSKKYNHTPEKFSNGIEEDGQVFTYSNQCGTNKNITFVLLRHSDRDELALDFFAQLNQKGYEKARTLVYPLKQYNIDYILSSPFIRTLETVVPYAADTGTLINPEYGLYEFRGNIYFQVDTQVWGVDDIAIKNIMERLNLFYDPLISKDDLVVSNVENPLRYESRGQMQNRVNLFMTKLINSGIYDNKTVLLVSHKGVLNAIRNFLEGSDEYMNETSEKDYPFAHFVVYKEEC